MAKPIGIAKVFERPRGQQNVKQPPANDGDYDNQCVSFLYQVPQHRVPISIPAAYSQNQVACIIRTSPACTLSTFSRSCR